MTDIAARQRIIEELAIDAEREWGRDLDRLSADEYVQCLLMCAVDRIHEGETRGYKRRPPAQPMAANVVTLKPHGLE